MIKTLAPIVISVAIFQHVEGLAQQVYPDKLYQDLQNDQKKVRAKKKFKFKYKRQVKRVDFSLVDTSAVYIALNDDSTFQFLRFFKGAVFQSGPYKREPGYAEVESLTYGVWRCYKMNHKGQIILEVPKRSEMDSRWIYYYGTVTTDRMEFTHYHMSYPPFMSAPGYFDKPWTFIKRPVEFKSSTYKWD